MGLHAYLVLAAVVFSIGHGLISEWIYKGGGDPAPASGEQAQ